MHEIYLSVVKTQEGNPNSIESLIKYQRKLDHMIQQQRNRQGHKWYVLLAVCFIMGISLYYGIIPSINLLFLQSKENTILHDAITNFIPSINVNETIIGELLLISWDFNNRTPFVFTKENLAKNE